jgi:hypothetical protein
VRCTEALLIHLQGDQAPVDEHRTARAHAARCPSCAGTVDDLSHDETDAATVLRSLAAHQTTPRRWIRTLLAGLSVLQLLLALPWLFAVNLLAGPDNHIGDSHLTRDGAIGLFLGAAGLIAAVRPRYVTPAIAVAAVGVVAQVVAGALDQHQAHVDAWFEMFHLLTVAILVLTAMIAGSRSAGLGNPTPTRTLRLLEPEAHSGRGSGQVATDPKKVARRVDHLELAHTPRTVSDLTDGEIGH